MKTCSETPEEANQEDDEDKAQEDENGNKVDLAPGVKEDVADRLGQVIGNEGEGRGVDCLWLDQNQAAQNQH